LDCCPSVASLQARQHKRRSSSGVGSLAFLSATPDIRFHGHSGDRVRLLLPIGCTTLVSSDTSASTPFGMSTASRHGRRTSDLARVSALVHQLGVYGLPTQTYGAMAALLPGNKRYVSCELDCMGRPSRQISSSRPASSKSTSISHRRRVSPSWVTFWF